MPFAGFARQLLAPRGGEGVVLGAAIILGLTPFRFDESLLLELEERGVQGAVVEREAVFARLLDAASDAIAVKRPEYVEGFENHQGERALLHVQLLGHGPSYWNPIRR